MKRITTQELIDGLSHQDADTVADLLSRLEGVSDEAITVAGELCLGGYDGKRARLLMDLLYGLTLEEVNTVLTAYRASDRSLIRPGLEAGAQALERIAQATHTSEVRDTFQATAKYLRDYADLMAPRSK